MSKARLFRYLRKNSVFLYSCLVALMLNRPLMLEVLDEGSKRYSQKKKYNELRDELNVPGVMPSFVKSQMERAISQLPKWVS